VLGFNGERYDLAARAYALGQGYRSYSPVLMRFHAPDHLSPFEQGGLNAYAFCEGDPVNYQDPTGHMRGASILLIPKKAYKRLISIFDRPAPPTVGAEVIPGTLTAPVTATPKKTRFSNLPLRITYTDEAELTRLDQFRYRAELIKYYERELMKYEPLLNEFADLRKKIEMHAANGIEIDVADIERFGILENTKLRFDKLRKEIRKTRSI
jgi:RHS repeat-associated protein